MKQEILQLFESSSSIALQDVAVNVLAASLLGLVIFVSYAVSHRGTIYSKKFNVSLVVLTVLTTTVMAVIGSNIALSLGMVGALSIVRFRTAVKDSRDTVYIFWTIIVGICCGVGNYLVAAVGSAAAFVLLLVLGGIKSDNRMLVIIRAARNRQSVIQAHMFKLFQKKAIMRARNTTDDVVEFIFEISKGMLWKVETGGVNVTESIFDLGGVEYVNIVMQNDEVSN